MSDFAQPNLPTDQPLPHLADRHSRMTENEAPPEELAPVGDTQDDAGSGGTPSPGPTRRFRKRWLAAAALVPAVAFLAGFVAFAEHVGAMTESLPTSRPADAIVVLTGGTQRISAALKLLATKHGKRLLISGVHPTIRRAELRRVTRADPQLFKCCVDLDRAARDTISNATESAKWIRKNGYHRVILVTSNYHIPRSLVEMRRAAANVEFIPYPVVTSDLHDNRWMSSRAATRLLFIEYVKYVASVARGLLPDSMMAASAQALEWAEGHR